MSKKFRPVFAASLVLLMFAQSVGAATPFKEAIQNQSLNQDGGYLPPEGVVPPSVGKNKTNNLLASLGVLVSVGAVATAAALFLNKTRSLKTKELRTTDLPNQTDRSLILQSGDRHVDLPVSEFTEPDCETIEVDVKVIHNGNISSMIVKISKCSVLDDVKALIQSTYYSPSPHVCEFAVKDANENIIEYEIETKKISEIDLTNEHIEVTLKRLAGSGKIDTSDPELVV